MIEETMSDQPEALRLAEYMDAPLSDPKDVADAAAAELRRLYAECDALRDALVWIAKRCPEPNWAEQPHNTHLEMVHDAGACARAALKETP